MEKLRTYLNGLPVKDQAKYAKRSGTTIAYLRKALSTQPEKMDAAIVVRLDRESGGEVPCEELRSDIDWAYVRSKQPHPPAASRRL